MHLPSKRRKNQRKRLNYPGKIDIGDGSPPHTCVIADVSESGAKLVADMASEVPNEFALVLAEGPTMRRSCRVIWRAGRQLGVEFRGARRRRPPVRR